MAVTNFGIRLEAQTTGEEMLRRMEDAINRVTKASGQAAEKTKDWKTSAEGIRSAIENPLQAAGAAAEKLLLKLGPTGGMLMGISAGAAAAGTAVYGLAKNFSDLWEQQANNATRMGLTLQQYQQLSRVSKDAGLASDVLVGSMRGLAKTLSDDDEEGKKAKAMLDRLKISVQDVTGEMLPMNQVFMRISAGLADIENPALRADAAIKIFGRSGIEILPLMTREFSLQAEALQRAGAGFTQYEEALGKATDATMDAWDRRWSKIQRTGGAAAATFLMGQFDRRGLQAIIAENTLRDQSDQAARMKVLTGAGPNAVPGFSAEQMAKELEAREARENFAFQESLKAREKAAEEAARKAKETAEKLAKYKADVFSYTFYGAGARGASSTGFNLLQGQYGGLDSVSFGSTNQFAGQLSGPSSILEGMGLDQFTNIEQANQKALDIARQATEYQVRKVQLIAGPGGEIAAINAAASLKLAALEREIQLGAKLDEVERARQQIWMDRELQILEFQKQRENSLRAAGGQIFDSITAGGGGLMNYLKGFGLGQARTIFGNAYAMGTGGLAGKLSLTSNPDSKIGQLLQGSIFGADPMKQSGAVHLTAAQMQMQAASTFSAGVAAFRIGGAVAGAGSLPMSASTTGFNLLKLAYGSGAAGGGIDTAGITANTIDGAPIWSVAGSSQNSGGKNMAAMKGVGYAAGLAAAGFGVYSGIKQGGAKGALTSVSSAMMAAAMIPGPQQPFVMAGALIAGFVSTILPDPKAQRAKELADEAGRRKYTQQSGVDYTYDIFGRGVDYGKNGVLRVDLTVNALDAKSIVDRADDIGEAVRVAFQSYPPLTADARAAILPPM